MANLRKIVYQQATLARKFKVLFILLILSSSAYAQSGTVKGHVYDGRTHESIEGAAVLLVNDKTGVTSGSDGSFSINIKSLPTTITVSYIGYKTEEIDIYEYTSDLTVNLLENWNLQNEVVVIGYGTQKRKELTGSVATLSKNSLSQLSTSFDNLLGGAVAGVNVSQSDGLPGASSNIRIRGGNSITGGNEPLYVVDGVIIYNDDRTDNNNSSTGAGINKIAGGLNPLASINPNDIESIDVLKDVSATAIYGSRGANGVIIITTKSGKKGRNNIEYQYTIGWQTARKKLDLLNAHDWAILNKELDSKSIFTDASISQLGEGYNWQDAALRTALTQNHNLSISGGDETTRYLVSGNFSDQDGILQNTGFKRYSGRFNFEKDIFSNLTIGLNANAGKLEQNGLSQFNDLYVNGASNLLDLVLRIPQVVPIYNADGSYNYINPFEKGDLTDGTVSVNPISDLFKSTSETKTNSLIGNFFVKWTIIPSLVAKVSAGTNLYNTTQNFYAPSSSAAGFLAKGYGSVGNRRFDSWQYEYTLNYTKQLNSDHYIDALAGYTTQTTKIESAVASASNFSNEQLSYHSLQGGSNFLQPNTSGSESILNSVLGRVNYSFKGRYNLTGSLRADGSSRFAPSHHWGYFPSLGVSWNVSDEKFLKNVKTISDLKLRGSLGTVGNQEIGDYRYAATYNSNKYSFNNAPVIGYSGGNTENPDLKWETTTSYNVGFDLGLWKSRLGLSFDAYYKKTSDLLLDTPVEITTGFTRKLANIGNVTNKGLELEVRGVIVESKDFNWNLSGNIARNINKVTSLGGGGDITQARTIIREGESLGTFYGVVFDGVVQSGTDLSTVPVPDWKKNVEYGDAKWVDQNEDKAITQDRDRVVLGSIQPDFTYGFNTTLSYKTLSLFASFQGSKGNKLYNSLRQDLEKPDTNYNLLATLKDRWSESNPSNTIPKAHITTLIYTDSRYVEDASYLKLKNITLSYTPPVKIVAAPSLKFRVFVTAQNLLTLTNYKGYDPEVSGYTDSGAYPTARTFSFGINISY
ncbi:SusC/RagA family TonB-linked outer membrane protein [Bacteroidia bacterium]|nr:SusC/RagA family TonB-linked outer membrane protein [Bacteroidia bacterium]